MYDNFRLAGRDFDIAGYIYPCESPSNVVVLIHGIGEHAGRYRRMAEYFNEAGIAIISMDLRGHGISGGKRGHCAPRSEILKDIDALIDYAGSRYPMVPIVMYGHSMGGNILLDYRARGAKNDIPSKYIVSAPWIKLVRPVSGLLHSVMKLMANIAPEATISSACNESDLGNLNFVRPYVEDPLVHTHISFRTALDGFEIGKAIMQGDNEDNCMAHGIPTLLMHGTDDRICDIEGSRTFAKRHLEILTEEGYADRFELVEWEGYYHEIHNGGPEGETGEDVIKKAIGFILK